MCGVTVWWTATDREKRLMILICCLLCTYSIMQQVKFKIWPQVIYVTQMKIHCIRCALWLWCSSRQILNKWAHLLIVLNHHFEDYFIDYFDDLRHYAFYCRLLNLTITHWFFHKRIFRRCDPRKYGHMLCVSILNTVTFKLEFLRDISGHEERESIF